MLEGDVNNLLCELLKAQPYKPPMHRSVYAIKINLLSKWVLVVALVLFLSMLIPAASIYFGVSSSWFVKLAGQGLGILSMIFGLGCLVLNSLSSLISMLRVSKDFDQDFLAQKDHDMKFAWKVLKYTEGSVEYCKKILEMKLSRIESRMADFFGGGDKIAFLSLAGMGWGLYKEEGSIQQIFVGLPVVFSYVFYGALAFVFGMCVGALIVKTVSRKCRYALEIIELSELLRNRKATS